MATPEQRLASMSQWLPLNDRNDDTWFRVLTTAEIEALSLIPGPYYRTMTPDDVADITGDSVDDLMSWFPVHPKGTDRFFLWAPVGDGDEPWWRPKMGTGVGIVVCEARPACAPESWF